MADPQSSSANALPALPAAAQPAQPIISAYLTWQKTLVEYKTFAHIGEGTFGSVYLATDPSGRRVALKRVRMENEREGFPVTAIREIKILQALSGHKNLVALLGVISGRGPATAGGDALTGTYLVFEYLDHDLNGLRAVQMHPAQIKYYLKQIFEGLYFLHKCKIVHRDIKGANILIGNDHVVKLADFGLARAAVDPRPAPAASSLVSNAEAARMNAQQLAHLVAERQRKHAQNEAIACSYTNRVVTLWYRAPELLLGAVQYDAAIDMWAVGCLFAEMLLQEPLFSGQSELAQLESIFAVCGAPDEQQWPDVARLPWWDRLRPRGAGAQAPRRLRDKFGFLPAAAFDLLDSLLSVEPARRLTAEQALRHDFFWHEAPPPARPQDLPSYTESYHENDVRVRKQREAEAAETQSSAAASSTSASVAAPAAASTESLSASLLPSIQYPQPPLQRPARRRGHTSSSSHVDALNAASAADGGALIDSIAPPPERIVAAASMASSSAAFAADAAPKMHDIAASFSVTSSASSSSSFSFSSSVSPRVQPQPQRAAPPPPPPSADAAAVLRQLRPLPLPAAPPPIVAVAPQPSTMQSHSMMAAMVADANYRGGELPLQYSSLQQQQDTSSFNPAAQPLHLLPPHLQHAYLQQQQQQQQPLFRHFNQPLHAAPLQSHPLPYPGTANGYPLPAPPPVLHVQPPHPHLSQQQQQQQRLHHFPPPAMAPMQTQHMQHVLPSHALPASNAPEYRDADMYGRSHAAYQQQPPPHQQQQQQQYQMYNQQYPRDVEQHALKRKRPNSPLQLQPASYHHLQHQQQHQPPPPPNFRPQQGFAVHGAPPPNLHPHLQQYQQPQQFQQHRGHDRGAR